MNISTFHIIIFASIIIIFIASKFFNRIARIKRKLKKANYKKITHFRDGDVAKIVGQVEFADNPLIAPLSKRECAYYYILIEQKVSSNDGSRWKTIIEEEKSNAFLIKEGNGCALINCDNIKSYIVQDKKYASGFLNDATDNLESYLNKKGYESIGLFGFNKKIRYKEGVLEEGEEIALYGKGVWKEAIELNLLEDYGKVLEITPTDKEAVYISDDPDITLRRSMN